MNSGKKWVKHMKCINLKFTPIIKRVETFRDIVNPHMTMHYLFVIHLKVLSVEEK